MPKKVFKMATRVGYIIAAFIIIFALLVSVGRLLTPYLNDHLPDFESWATEILQVPIKINHVEISWNAYEPEIAFQEVRVLNKQTLKPQFAVREIKVNLDVLRSLLTWSPVTERIKIRGAHLTIVKTARGLPFIEELKGLSVVDNSTESTSHLADVFAWILTQHSLVLRDIEIGYRENLQTLKSITIDRLILKNNNNHHDLFGDAMLNQEFPLHVQTHLDWTGEFTDLEHVAANMYFYVEGISLSQWLSQYNWKNLNIVDGEGSAKIWLTWNQNQFERIQSQFQFYDLTLHSSLTKRSIRIPRLSGNVGWKKQGKQEIFAANDILIDFPNHLWPTTHFELIYSNEDVRKLRNIQVAYFDLSDLKQLAVASGLLPDDVKQKLLDINPRGEIRNLTLSLPTGKIEDIDLVSLGFNFSNLGVHAWDKYPGVTGVQGSFAWGGKQGNINMNSHNASIDYPVLFYRPLLFKQFTTYLQWQKLTDGSWMVLLKNLQAINQNINLQVRMTLAVPVKGSPIINLSGSFNLNNVSKVTDYLPMKTYEPDLVAWLKRAFLKGQIESGKAVIQGKIVDYPFENGSGTLLVSGMLKDLDLKFDPKWPTLSNINGELIFSGTSMTADFNSAKMLGIDFSFVRAHIPYLGMKAPQILNVQGFVQSDLSEGMKVIQHSPLQSTLGTDLANLNPQGPMQLKLDLTIPLKDPDKIAVQGDLGLTNAMLNISLGHLIFDHLNGNLHFTEKGIEGKNVQGNIFNAPAQLDLTTVKETNKLLSYVKVNIIGSLSVNELQNWLNVSFADYASGSTSYQAELHLASHSQPQPTQITLLTDLKGIELNLPGVLAKKANESRNLTTDITIVPYKPLLIKMQYDKLLTGAVSFNTTSEGMRFASAELSAKVFNILGQHLNNPRIKLTKRNTTWVVNMTSSEITGQINLAESFKEIQAKFQHVYLSPGGEHVNQIIKPQDIPALMISANDFHYGDFKLGTVTLITKPLTNGMAIKQLDANDGVTHLSATGSWQESEKTQISRFQGKLDTTNINQTIAQWGSRASSLVGSNATAQFNLSWPDSPYNPTFKSITGSLNINLGHGRIVNLSESTEAKIGIGRMLSLLSMQSIPRRLSLDFSDLFQNGYSFDSIKGNFKLKGGNAYTNDLHLEGPVASINLAGRIGFQAKDFGLTLGVTTYMTSSLLPAAVGWLGGPIAGVATWVVSAAMSQATSKVATYQYSITGPWSNPQWRQMSASAVSSPPPLRH